MSSSGGSGGRYRPLVLGGLVVALLFGASLWLLGLLEPPPAAGPSDAVVADRTWSVEGTRLRSGDGFLVVPWNETRATETLRDALSGSNGPTSRLLVPEDDFRALRAALVGSLPRGSGDPFAYGVAWRIELDLWSLTAEPARVL